jgi:molybdopterin/thiamine biosynthesis adenylyltransferase/molybdopterin synthase catalytic subunit/rhodanese-related sulfurtransferase
MGLPIASRIHAGLNFLDGCQCMNRFTISTTAIDTRPLRESLQQPGAGGFCSFEGWVRNSNEGRDVNGLSYEAYVELAHVEGERIIDEAMKRYGIADARCTHRTGDLGIGDMAVWVGASAAHRDEAFRACRYIIDEIKHRLPIWKKEHYVTGETSWVVCNHTSHAHRADVQSGHEPHDRASATSFVPDYSRQICLPGVGEVGQARLSAARVLVIGAGGLGAPAISYLAGAGVGTLGIVDADRLDASNLQRQTIYDARDIGQRKVDLAARRVAAINPSVHVRTFAEPLHAGNVVGTFAQFDLVLECTDDMHSRYLSSDGALLSGKPLILASVYQYEGQLQVMDGQPGSPCLRCLWPREPSPADLGSCALSGVLGPVPGVLGAMQAMEALKLLLDLPRPSSAALLLLSLLDNTSQRLPIDAASGCALHGGCEHQARLSLAHAQDRGDIDLSFCSLEAAIAAGFQVIDLRETEEISISPVIDVSTRHIPSRDIVARAAELGQGRFLLVCASGRRSAHAVQQLRAAGLHEVHSLAGGIDALRASVEIT